MLKTENLTRKFGSFTALDGLSITIGKGEIHGFVGPNGAGKTTAMRIMATLLPASEGKVFIDGINAKENPRRTRELMGYMPDFFGVYDHLQAWEYLDFYGRCYGMKAGERKKQAERLLSLVNLSDQKDSYVNILSRGMKQRLCLARALMHDPQFLILDEPASGMDPMARAEMKNIIKELKSLGKTVLISSHILPELSEMCDSFTILDHGKTVFSGSKEALERKISGQQQIIIRLLSADQQEKALSLLRPLCPDAQVLSPCLIEAFAADEEAAAALLSRLIAGGVQVADFHRQEMNLEKVFLEVIQHD